MPFIVSEDIGEQDYDRLFVINYEAFSEEPILLALFPGGLDPSVRAQNVASFKAGLGFADVNVKAAKVIDDQSSQIVAFATMRLFGSNPFYPAEDSHVQFPFAEEAEWVEWFFNYKTDRRREIEKLTRPGAYGYLQALGTDPMRQREGAGALLMSWAGEKLDEKGVRGMLEASRAAVQYGLYEKYGFRAVDSFTYVDTERFPDAKPISIVTMIRDIKST